MITCVHSGPCRRSGVKYSQCSTAPAYAQRRLLPVVSSPLAGFVGDIDVGVLRIAEREAMQRHGRRASPLTVH